MKYLKPVPVLDYWGFRQHLTDQTL